MSELYRLGLSVTGADGRTTRWGRDEPDGRNVPGDLEFGTSIPGGFKDLRCSLFRELNRENADNVLFDDVRVYGPGNETAWEGRFAQFPRQTSQTFSVEPGAVGWSAHLADDPSFVEVYVDSSAGSWQTMPFNRRVALGATITVDQDYRFSTDNGGLSFQGSDAKAITSGSRTEAWYIAPPGATITSLEYIGAESNTTNVVAASFVLIADDSSGASTTAALTLDSTLRTATPATPTRYAFLHAQASGTHTPAAGAALLRRFAAQAVYGGHGLTRRAIDSSTPDGLYGSDVIADVIARTAPLLNYTTGAGGSIEPTTFAIPHLVFADPVTGADAVSRISAFGVNSFQLPEWGIYDDRVFFWRTPDPDRLCWQARISDGAHLTLEGDQADDLFNGVVVSYTDPGGRKRIAGPPAAYWYNGTALADATDTSLVDTSTTNPVNAHGIPRKWAKLDLSNPTTQAGAIQLGAVFLAVQSQPQRRGQITLRGTVSHPTVSAPQPVWKIRAGDYISVSDSATPDLRRRIIETRYAHEDRTLVATVDNTPLTLDALLEQMQAALVGRIS